MRSTASYKCRVWVHEARVRSSQPSNHQDTTHVFGRSIRPSGASRVSGGVGVAISAVRFARKMEEVSETGAKRGPRVSVSVEHKSMSRTCWVARPSRRAGPRHRLGQSGSFGGCSPPAISEFLPNFGWASWHIPSGGRGYGSGGARWWCVGCVWSCELQTSCLGLVEKSM